MGRPRQRKHNLIREPEAPVYNQVLTPPSYVNLLSLRCLTCQMVVLVVPALLGYSWSCSPLCMGPPLAGHLAHRSLVLREEATVRNIIANTHPKTGGRC